MKQQITESTRSSPLRDLKIIPRTNKWSFWENNRNENGPSVILQQVNGACVIMRIVIQNAYNQQKSVVGSACELT